MPAGEPDAALFAHGTHQLLEQPDPGRPAAQPRVQRQHKTTTVVVHGFEFTPPQVEYLAAIFGHSAPRRVGIEGKLLPVLEHPLPGDFHEAVVMKIRHVIPHLAGAIDEVIPGEQFRRPRVDLEPRRAKTRRSPAGEPR